MTEHQNVDNAEIAKFEAIAERWWDRDGEFKPLHEINPLRLDFVADKVGGLFDKETLDVGCGGGIVVLAVRPVAGRSLLRLDVVYWLTQAGHDVGSVKNNEKL